jgi:chemotaxis protein methyltransferase CheR
VDIRPLTDEEFQLIRNLVSREAGIHLSEAKKPLVAGRLGRRVRELGLKTFGAYYRLANQDEAERRALIDRISTNETHFFREPKQFEFLAGTVIPRWIKEASSGHRTRHFRLWSAACSTGEEPYSLAMVLLDSLACHAGFSFEIQASDVSTRVLDRATAGLFSMEKAGEIPDGFRRRFMLRGTRSQEGMMAVKPFLRSAVTFSRVNLNASSWPLQGPFDAIFCRNVLIYFDAPMKHKVVDRLLGLLAPGGMLFLGHAESLAGLTDRVVSVGPTVYAARMAPRE